MMMGLNNNDVIDSLNEVNNNNNNKITTEHGTEDLKIQVPITVADPLSEVLSASLEKLAVQPNITEKLSVLIEEYDKKLAALRKEENKINETKKGMDFLAQMPANFRKENLKNFSDQKIDCRIRQLNVISRLNNGCISDTVKALISLREKQKQVKDIIKIKACLKELPAGIKLHHARVKAREAWEALNKTFKADWNEIQWKKEREIQVQRALKIWLNSELKEKFKQKRIERKVFNSTLSSHLEQRRLKINLNNEIEKRAQTKKAGFAVFTSILSSIMTQRRLKINVNGVIKEKAQAKMTFVEYEKRAAIDYLNKRAAKYSIVDTFSTWFARLAAWCGVFFNIAQWIPEKEKRESYVYHDYCKVLDAFANGTASVAEVDAVIQKGKHFRPRADAGQSFQHRLFQAQQNLQKLSQEHPDDALPEPQSYTVHSGS